MESLFLILIARAQRIMGKELRASTRKGEKFDNKDLKIKYLRVTLSELWQILFEFKGSKTATIEYLISPNFTAEGREKFPNVRKFGYIAAHLGAIYSKSVRTKQESEGLVPDFQGQSIWNGMGKHLSQLCVIHVLKLSRYLQYNQLHARQRPDYVDITTGERIEAAKIKPYLVPFKPAGNQGVSEPLHFPVVKLENILKIKTFGTTLIVAENEYLLQLRAKIQST